MVEREREGKREVRISAVMAVEYNYRDGGCD
jgi:hypothetical protein